MTASSKHIAPPRIVTIGGGTGHFTLLSGLKKHNVELTAIVTMADDGGSTGVLRDELGVLPPGDLRQCLVALSEAGDTMRALFTHRFNKGTLKGHTLGNLILSGMEQVTGSIDDAIAHVGDILKIRGQVLPVSNDTMNLYMKLKNGKVLKGEHAVDGYQHISRFGVAEIGLRPAATLNPAVKRAVLDAELIVIGPGDLYTSLLPNLLVTAMVDALRKSRARKIFVCPLMNKYGQTDDFTCARYVEELERLAHVRFIDAVLYNTAPIPAALIKRYVDEGEPVPCVGGQEKNVQYVGANLLSETIVKPKKGDPIRRTLIRHDPTRLAAAIVHMLHA